MKTKKKKEDLKVFISSRDSQCDECGEHLGRHALIILQENKGAVCLSCADMDHLVFLPSGDAALTRRSRKHSRLSAVVLKWRRNRKRYERQGLLVEESAIEQAERECEDDADKRELRRARAAARREVLDEAYLLEFADRVRELFPGCPKQREEIIARHACQKYSGRVGRSSAAKNLDADAVRLAVIAHIRHSETNYDQLLMDGHARKDARRIIKSDVLTIRRQWEKSL